MRLQRSNRPLVIRADGNSQIGMGHFTRSLALAEILREDFDCTFAIVDPSPYQKKEIFKYCNNLLVIPDDNSKYNFFIKHLFGDEIVLLDDYSFPSIIQNQIRNKGCKVVYIDDFNDKNYVCDALINNIPGYSEGSFKKEPYTKLFLGTDYALLRREFFKPSWRSIPKKSDTIFVSFGGSDPNNLSKKIISFLHVINPSFQISLLLGDAFNHLDDLVAFQNVRIYKNVEADIVARLIAEAELCIVPASSLLNEVSSIGSKVLTGYFTENQFQPYSYFTNNKLAIGIGDFKNVELSHFDVQLSRAIVSEYLIPNQREKYHYQQESNLKDIFLSL